MKHGLCIKIGEPPPNVDDSPIEGGSTSAGVMTIRAATELATSEGVCASCHTIINPVGFTFQNYVRLGSTEQSTFVVARRRVTDLKNPTDENLFEDPLPPQGTRIRMENRARNAVHAMAISVDGEWLYCHERKTPGRQQIVRRWLSDFQINGELPPDLLPSVSEQGQGGQ